jgi:hypothetical protein
MVNIKKKKVVKVEQKLYKKHYSSAKVSLLHLTKVTQKSLFSFSLSLSLSTDLVGAGFLSPEYR